MKVLAFIVVCALALGGLVGVVALTLRSLPPTVAPYVPDEVCPPTAEVCPSFTEAGVIIASDAPLVQPDQWLTSATADGGAPASILNEVGLDAGPHVDVYRSFTVTNDNSTCINLGSTGCGDADPVNVNEGLELGTGAGCADGVHVSIPGRPSCWGVTSQGAAVNVRVGVTK